MVGKIAKNKGTEKVQIQNYMINMSVIKPKIFVMIRKLISILTARHS